MDYLLADHQPCIISIEISSQFANKSKHTIFTKTDYKALRNKVEEHDWSRIIDPCSVQLSMENFLSTFEALIKSSSTEVKAKVPWMTRDLLTLTEKRRQLHVQSKKEPFNLALKTKYRKFRNYVSNAIKNAKKNYLSQQFEQRKVEIYQKPDNKEKQRRKYFNDQKR